MTVLAEPAVAMAPRERPGRFHLIVPGEPVAKGRGRIVRLGAHMGIKTPEKTRRYEDIVRQTAILEWGMQPLADCAITMMVGAYRGIAQSWPKHRRARALAGQTRPIGRPDADNYAKAVLDGLLGVVYQDDSLVVDLRVVKFYSDQPRLEIDLSW